MIERVAHAKLNLALHITGIREDGYHLIDSIVSFTELGDRIIVSKPHHAHGPVEVFITGLFGKGLSAGPENLATSAALLFRQELKRSGFEPSPVIIQVEKNLPIASGIGGGSADAAATLLALRDFWNVDYDLSVIARALGADVPMCLHSRPLRAQGIGDRIAPLQTPNALPVVLVNPGLELSTAKVFKMLMNKNQPAISKDPILEFPTLKALEGLRNDLQTSARLIAPDIGTVLSVLETTGSTLSRMSGSGATCFGIFDTMEEAEDAKTVIDHDHPNWWCVATKTTVS